MCSHNASIILLGCTLKWGMNSLRVIYIWIQNSYLPCIKSQFYTIIPYTYYLTRYNLSFCPWFPCTMTVCNPTGTISQNYANCRKDTKQVGFTHGNIVVALRICKYCAWYYILQQYHIRIAIANIFCHCTFNKHISQVGVQMYKGRLKDIVLWH